VDHGSGPSGVEIEGHLVPGVVRDHETGWISPDPSFDSHHDVQVTDGERHAVAEALRHVEPVSEQARHDVLSAVFGPAAGTDG
jgi:hypothetical protein